MTTDAHQFDIAVIMPVLNEEKHIGTTLDQIYMQDYPMDRVQLIVADGGSTDRTREIVSTFKDRFGSLKLLDNPKRLSSAGRNVGARNSNSRFILVLDGHTHLPSKTLLKDMVGLFESSGAACLCRPQPLTPPDINEFEKSVALCRGSGLGHKPGSEIYSDIEAQVDPTSSGAMYVREVFEKVGAFDESFDACEDVDFNYRVHQHGLKAWTSPKLTVCYYPRSSLGGLWRQMVRYGRGRFRLAEKHKLFSPVMSLAASGVAGLGLLLLVSLVSSWAASWFRTAIGLYLLLVVFYSAYLSQRHRHVGCLLHGPLVFPTIHFGLGFGFLYEIVSKLLNKQRPR
ncbi:MAG: glycosyltransferase family 2 protein [candidate division Zixibacteria bacterium]|nr:glycosyltransferase family 2 protein [candidate division Zixibacteria bacterium]MDH3937377.1 glycosyltransferase family 2 protein [candidate division Zixibacteria bacterium]MDH4033251.1 glycosyltransferase family 2 protein [candidate division Zixibacteria bacterium]